VEGRVGVGGVGGARGVGVAGRGQNRSMISFLKLKLMTGAVPDAGATLAFCASRCR
jgi:hypothetical protein